MNKKTKVHQKSLDVMEEEAAEMQTQSKKAEVFKTCAKKQR